MLMINYLEYLSIVQTVHNVMFINNSTCIHDIDVTCVIIVQLCVIKVQQCVEEATSSMLMRIGCKQ